MTDEPLAVTAIVGVLPGRDPEVCELLALFGYAHLPDYLAVVSEPFAFLAADMVNALTDGRQLKAGLYDLLRAKDCMVRQRLLDRQAADA